MTRGLPRNLHYKDFTVSEPSYPQGNESYAWKKSSFFRCVICAEYRDMLPRPRLVCQEPGLRPIGRSPGVPDKSSRGLGSMSRYSAQILICFIAYIFSIFNFSVGLVGNLAELPPCLAQCPLPLFIVIRMRLLSAHQTIKSPSMPCWGAAGRNTLWHSCHRTGEISR